MESAIKNDKSKVFKKSCYLLCTLILCFVNQRKGSATGVIQVIVPNIGIISLALLLIPSMKLSEFKHKRYLIWLLANSTLIPLITAVYNEQITEKFNIILWWSGALSLTVWGLLFIQAASGLKKPVIKSTISNHGFQLIMSLTLLMFCLSANDDIWPWQYLLVYTTIVLTEISSEDKVLIVRSIENGILISFFVIQGLAFVFRPYDQVRYLGLFSNPNINALFYFTVYAAFISKYCSCYDIADIKKRRLLRTITLAFSGAMWSFVFLTGSRCTIMAMIAVTAMAGIYCLVREERNIICRGAVILAGLILWMIIAFPIVFASVRYLPAVFHHPIWFNNEYHESRVHSFDPWNSDKYVDLPELLGNGYGRFVEYSTIEDVQQSLEASEADSDDSISIRALIYRGYLHNLNMRGHITGGIFVTEDIYAHAQNLYLQMAYNHGISAGLLFMLFTVSCAALMYRNSLIKASEATLNITWLISAMLYAGTLIFGLFEMMWIRGELPFTLLFILPALLKPQIKKAR